MSLVLLSLVLWQRYQRTVKGWWQNWRAKPKRTRTMRPRTPDDCQDCRAAEAEMGPNRSQARRAWVEVKSLRGRPKEHDSSGTHVTPAREKAPAPLLEPARQFQRLHPAAYRAGPLLFRVQRSPSDRLTTLRL